MGQDDISLSIFIYLFLIIISADINFLLFCDTELKNTHGIDNMITVAVITTYIHVYYIDIQLNK